jgi:hypothetical protein
MNTRKALALTLAVVGAVLAGGAAACVGDDPQSSGADAAPSATTTTTPTGTTTSTGTAPPPTDGATPPPTDGATPPPTDGATPPDATVDAGGDAAPSIACVAGTLSSSAFVTRCQANPSAVSPGGTIVPGVYNLTGATRGLYCTSTYIIGSAEVFTTPGGDLMMRTLVFKRAAPGDVGVKVQGTSWLRGTGTSFSRVEMCDPGRVGETDLGSLQSTVVNGAPVFTLTFPRSPGAQEEWTKVP